MYGFKPWRRKLGVLALVIACVVMTMWLRTRNLDDRFTLICPKDSLLPSFSVISSAGGAHFYTYQQTGRVFRTEYGSDHPESIRARKRQMDYSRNARNKIVIPYWAILALLTFLSAYLLVSKLRPAETQTAAGLPIEGV
ncbi:hypothetical protein [Schlesneria paludicola]|uniref:hypothetical protein n=1 Tax=Schlesneria paludicola TaxID=360056 RepID=UPI000299D184|nr:hypothetical protein [Schlesneria paludicola]